MNETRNPSPPNPAGEHLSAAPGGLLMRRLEALVMELPPDSRAAILLRHQHDLPYEEIAQALGAPLGTIKARIHRARLMLKEKLLAQGDIPWDVHDDEPNDEP